jgi:hypothetical protein
VTPIIVSYLKKCEVRTKKTAGYMKIINSSWCTDLKCSVTFILTEFSPYMKSMKNNLAFVKTMNIFTANNSRREKEVFIGAFHTRATRLKPIKILDDRSSRSGYRFYSSKIYNVNYL